MPEPEPRPSRLDRLISMADRVDVSSPWVVRTALVLFFGGAFLAVQAADVQWSELRPGWLVATAVLSSPMLLLTSSEFRVTAKLLGVDVPMRKALQIAVVSTTANLLPLPGGVVVRAQSLLGEGVPRRRTVVSQLALALVWLAEATLATALLLLGDEPLAAALFALVGVVGAVGGVAIIRWLRPEVGLRRGVVLAAAVEMLFVVLAAARIGAALAALGFSPTLEQAVALASANVLAVFVVVVPAGLGVRELIAAGIAPLVGLSAATGFIVAAVVRVMTMTAFGIVALFVVRRDRAEEPP